MHADDIRRSVAALRLGAWPEVGRRLRPRLVPTDRAGPLHRPIPGRASGRADSAIPSPLVWDLGVDVPGGIVRIDPGLRRSWPPGDPTLWAVAVANLARLTPPRPIPVRLGPFDLTVVADGPWTTGWLLRPGGPVGRTDADLAVVGSAELVVLAGGGPAGTRKAGCDRAEVARRLAAGLGGRLVGGGQETEPVTLVRAPGPAFPPRWILE